MSTFERCSAGLPKIWRLKIKVNEDAVVYDAHEHGVARHKAGCIACGFVNEPARVITRAIGRQRAITTCPACTRTRLFISRNSVGYSGRCWARADDQA